MRVLHEGMGDKYRPCPLLVQFVAAGRLGKKQGSHSSTCDYVAHDMFLFITLLVHSMVAHRLHVHAGQGVYTYQ